MKLLVDRQLDLAADLIEARVFDSAYHALMGALHLADHLGDEPALDLISAAAIRLDGEIEATRPPHPLSRAEAERRGHQSLCDSLRTHIESVRLRLRSDAQLRRAQEAGR